MASPPSCQFVGHVAPLEAEVGNPLVQRASPESCHPPMTDSRAPCELPAKWRPLPKGSSMIQLALSWCLASKSDTARSALGSHELITCPPSPLYASMRSASDERSIDFEYV